MIWYVNLKNTFWIWIKLTRCRSMVKIEYGSVSYCSWVMSPCKRNIVEFVVHLQARASVSHKHIILVWKTKSWIFLRPSCRFQYHDNCSDYSLSPIFPKFLCVKIIRTKNNQLGQHYMNRNQFIYQTTCNQSKVRWQFHSQIYS